MEATNNSTITKLVLLYVFDKMEIPLTESTIIDMCCSRNQWVSYMSCKEVLSELIDTGFVLAAQSNSTDTYYSITSDGRACLSYFFIKIPASLRDEISEFVKENRMNFRRMQEYFRDYYKNADGTYTVALRIVEPLGTRLEIKLNVKDRYSAKVVYKRWEDKASQVYSALYDILVD